jgi:glycosyltransferase involved in cell wall biosynthesis
MKSVTVFTDYYPEPHKEYFIAMERPYLEREFERVQYVPESVSIGANHWVRKAKILMMGALPSLMLMRRCLRGLVYAGKTRAIMQWIEREKPQGLLYSYWLGPAATAIAATCATGIARCHNGDLYEEQYDPPWIPCRHETVSGLSRVYCCSEHGREYLRQKYPAMGDKLRVARLGVGRNPLRNPWVHGTELRVLSVCGLESYKRPLLLVDTVAALARGDRVKWTHVGPGSMESEFLCAVRSKLRPQGFCHIPKMDNDILHNLYSCHPPDVFLLTSRWEGVPVAVMEAMAYGVPVVCADAGGTREAAADGGIVVTGDDPEGFADGVRRVVADRVEYSRKAERAWMARWQADVNLSAFAREIARI